MRNGCFGKLLLLNRRRPMKISDKQLLFPKLPASLERSENVPLQSQRGALMLPLPSPQNVFIVYASLQCKSIKVHFMPTVTSGVKIYPSKIYMLLDRYNKLSCLTHNAISTLSMVEGTPWPFANSCTKPHHMKDRREFFLWNIKGG